MYLLVSALVRLLYGRLNASTELFDSDLERSTVALILENQGLLQENKQLTTLLTEYESTLETVMTKFRQHAV
jgi:hypothetical protein